MNRNDLVQALAPYRSPLPNLDAALTRLLGGVSLESASDSQVLGAHMTVNDALLAIYIATPKAFLMLEATPDGTMLSVMVPYHRVRRVAMLENPSSSRLTIEIDADRAEFAGEMDAEGQIRGNVRPAGYEIVAMGEVDRYSLREFHGALTRAAVV